MTTYLPHCKITMSGIITAAGGTEVEIFSMSLAVAFELETHFDQAAIDSMTGAGFTDPFTDWFGSSEAHISSLAKLTLIKAAPIAPNGRYEPGVNASFNEVNVAGGSSSSALNPSTSAYAISLRTGIRGPAARGRFFVPCPVIPVDTTWHWSSGDMPDIANAALGLVNAVNAEMTTLFPASGVNVVVASGAGTGNNHVVTEVLVGNVPDNIRRRKNHLVNTYTQGT